MIHELCGGEDAKTDILLRAEHSTLPYSLQLDQMWVSVLNAMDGKKNPKTKELLMTTERCTNI